MPYNPSPHPNEKKTHMPLVEMCVLKTEVKKEFPYTPYHCPALYPCIKSFDLFSRKRLFPSFGVHLPTRDLSTKGILKRDCSYYIYSKKGSLVIKVRRDPYITS